MILPACMGGWCLKRDRCADHLATDRKEIAERLCAKGHDNPEPIRVERAAEPEKATA